MNDNVRDLIRGYLETTVSINVVSQCRQCSLGALIAKEINKILDTHEDLKVRRSVEKSLKAELTGKYNNRNKININNCLAATNQKSFWKFCFSVKKLADEAGIFYLFLVDVIPPDVYRKVTDIKISFI